MSDLPKGWVNSILVEVGSIVTGNTPPKKELTYYGDKYPWVKPPDLEKNVAITATNEKLSEEGAKKARILPVGTVLVSCIGQLGKVGIAGTELATNQQINSIIFNEKFIINKYGYYYCKTLKSWMEENSSSTTLPILNKSRFEQAPILVPPLNEQKRIVEKLDKLLARVEEAKARLEKIPVIIKRFRQSVLNAAVTGELTKDWRERNAKDFEWKELILKNLFDMKNGKGLTNKKMKAGEVPVYGGNGLSGYHNIGNTEGQTIIIGRVGAQCGNVHYFEGKVWVTDNAILLKPKQKVNLKYYSMILKAFNLNTISGGTGQPYVSQDILAPLNLPNPKRLEQDEIVSRIEVLFKKADEIEERYKKAKAYVDKLTQSILAKAFRGELVPQDPNDPPASELLEKIREEREQLNANAKSKRKSNSKKIKNN